MLTQSELKEQLHYNPSTGVFTWLVSNSNRVKIGDIAGSIHSTGYVIIRIKSKDYKSHRLALLYIYGEFPEHQTDHINHNRSDNRIANLRAVTNQENQKNASIRVDSKSGITGVHWNKRLRKWGAQIQVNGKNKHLGVFQNVLDATKSRMLANKKYGYHENHGAKT